MQGHGHGLPVGRQSGNYGRADDEGQGTRYARPQGLLGRNNEQNVGRGNEDDDGEVCEGRIGYSK